MNYTVIHHSADYDGIFCREIAKKFLPNAKLIGWDFKDKPLMPIFDDETTYYILDLPVDRVYGFDFSKPETVPHAFQQRKGSNLIWIDHHKSSIDSHPDNIPGYRIDGVAACRLAWQYFNFFQRRNQRPIGPRLPEKKDYLDRIVSEPLAVRLAGEYDVWDHRGDGDLEFQFGLDSAPNPNIQYMLGPGGDDETKEWVHDGGAAMRCYAKRDADVLHSRSFLVQFEGLTFLALNTPRANSNTFASRDFKETGHDALMAFYYDGSNWNFSLYHAQFFKELDLSKIAVKYGGGGHRGACGFRSTECLIQKDPDVLKQTQSQ